ncbi:hypothetical protein [Nostoc sp.]
MLIGVNLSPNSFKISFPARGWKCSSKAALPQVREADGLLVRDWIEQHKDEIISHNAKFGMENKKDPSKESQLCQ